MAGQTIPTEEVSNIFFSRTPLVIGTADSIKNLSESNTTSEEGYAKLVSGASGILGVPVGMAELSSNLIVDLSTLHKIHNISLMVEISYAVILVGTCLQAAQEPIGVPADDDSLVYSYYR